MEVITFCEGSNDLEFFRKFFENQCEGFSSLFFNGEQMCHSNLKNQQSDKIRDLIGNPEINFLAKAEGGKPNIRKVVPHFLPSLINRVDTVIILADTDEEEGWQGSHEKNLEQFNESIKQSVESKYQGSGHSIEVGEIVRENDAVIANENYLINRKEDRIGKFLCIQWKSSLETIANVNEEYSNVDEKLDELLADDEIINFFRDIITD